MHRPKWTLTTIAACLPFPSLGVIHLHGRDLNVPLLDSYDYIVVGCGISGLVVTNRLSEDPSVNVLCIEAGDPDRYEPIIQDPVYVGADIGGIYDWLLSTTPQTQLDGAPRPMPQGKVLGGGSILNAMCWNRGGQDDYDAWAALGNPGWDWEGMLPYFIKSETYTPVYSADIAREYSINYNPLVHGFSGPVQVSYPRYFYPQSTNLFAALNYLGVPTQFDPNDGSSAGAAFVPSDLDPNNQTRSDARRTYFDPYVSRPNFHVITGQHVTRILIEGIDSNFVVDNPTPGGNEDGNGMNGVTSNEGFGFGPGGSTPALDNSTSERLLRRQSPATSNLRITGVEFAASASGARRNITATREVIIAAGSLHSAQLLQLSGIGPSSLLDRYGIPIALDLPGVGNNLQDHCLVGTFYPYNNASYPSPTDLTTNATYNAAAEFEYNSFKTGPWTAGSPNALAFNPLPLISNNSASILTGANDQDPTEYLVGGLDPSIIAGYTLQKQSLVRRLAETTVASYEIINNNAGSLTIAVMHPFSRGQCYIRSPDPFEPPSIDPRWLTNPVDRQVLIEALLFNRQILATPAMVPLHAAQFVPAVDASIDDINTIINTGIRTEFHPSGTCAMLPLEQGGVVDPHLRVHGAQNLRVVDAGIFPMIPAAHLQAVVYAVAEKAADIIKADNVGVSAAAPSSSSASASSLLASLTTSSGITTSTSSDLTASAVTPSSSIGLTTSGTATALSSSSSVSSSSFSSSSTTAFASSSSLSNGTLWSVLSSTSAPGIASSSLLSILVQTSSGTTTSSGSSSSVSQSGSFHISSGSLVSALSSSEAQSASLPTAPSSLVSSVSGAGSTTRISSAPPQPSSSGSVSQSGSSLTASSVSLQPSTSGQSVPLSNAPSLSSIGQNSAQTGSASQGLSGTSQSLLSVASTQTSTGPRITDTTSYNLPTTYSLPSSYPLPSSYSLPSSYPLPTTYTLPSTVFNQLPSSYSLPSSVSYNLLSTSTSPTSVSEDPTISGPVLLGLGHEVLHTKTHSPSETTAIVVSSLPTSLVQLLSTLGIPTAVQTASGVRVTVTPHSTVLNPSQLSSSVKHALTAGGVPTAVASALLPVIVASFDTTVTVPTNLPSAVRAALESAVRKEQLELQASIDGFIQWLVNFLHLS